MAVLAYNEEATVEATVRGCARVLEAAGVSYELILVDDGSTDTTTRIMTRLGGEIPRCRLAFHPTNRGIGESARACYFEGRGEWVTWLPADLQADPEELPRLLAMLDDCDVLVTYRDHRRRRISQLRRFLSSSDRAVAGLLFGLWLRDNHWIRFFRRSLLDGMDLGSRSAAVDIEMVLAAREAGARILEAPWNEQPRTAGVATGGSLSNAYHAARDLVALRLRGSGSRGVERVSAQETIE